MKVHLSLGVPKTLRDNNVVGVAFQITAASKVGFERDHAQPSVVCFTPWSFQATTCAGVEVREWIRCRERAERIREKDRHLFQHPAFDLSEHNSHPGPNRPQGTSGGWRLLAR